MLICAVVGVSLDWAIPYHRLHVDGIFLLVEKVGSLELKVSHVTRNFFMLAFIVTQGMQQTTRTYVSGLLGAGRLELDQTLRRLFTLTLSGFCCFATGTSYTPIIWQPVFYRCSGTRGDGQNLASALHRRMHVCLTGIMLSTIQGSGATNVAFAWNSLR